MKINRMFGILGKLLDCDTITAKELAEYFEVSTRTIHRDLLDLSSAGFPVATKQGIGGGIYLLDTFRYNKTAFTEEELNIIMAGLKGLDAIDGGTVTKTILAKLRLNPQEDNLNQNDIVIDFSTWNYNSTLIDKIKTIRAAIAAKTQLQIDYYSGHGQDLKIVEPYKIVFKNGDWYLWGYAPKSSAFRTYKVNRMAAVTAADTPFIPQSDAEMPTFKADFVGPSGEEITVRMDRSYEFIAIDFFGIENIRRKENDENIYVTFQTESVDWVINIFSEFGDKAEILSPPHVRSRMKEHLSLALKQYQT